jgi:hypothetical protein
MTIKNIIYVVNLRILGLGDCMDYPGEPKHKYMSLEQGGRDLKTREIREFDDRIREENLI